MRPSSNIKTEKYSDSKIIDSPSKDQRKGADPISTVRDKDKGAAKGG